MKRSQVLNADQRDLLECLLSEIGPRLLGYVRKVFGRGIDAEEIVAETFSRAADNIESIAAIERKDLYLLTIARNLCRDTFRRKRPEVVANELLQERPDPILKPDGEIIVQEDRQRLRQAVAKLPEAQREIVVLRMSSGLKFEEIAKLLEIPLGTALSRMNAAMKSLRKELDSNHVSNEV